MINQEIAAIFNRMANMLEFQGENPFKIRAYRTAALNLREVTRDLKEAAREGRLQEIPGIGHDLAAMIEEYSETGKVGRFEALRRAVPEGLVALVDVQGLGPKTLARLHETFRVKNLEGLERVLGDPRLLKLPGMGPKKLENMRRGIALFRQAQGRTLLGQAMQQAEEIMQHLRRVRGVRQLVPAGSLRRMEETVGDVDILAIAERGDAVIRAFTRLPMVTDVLAAGETKGSVILKGGLQVDVRVVPSESFGAALQYFTGSKAHNIHLRRIARARGLKISEYGVFREEKRIAGKTEEEVYGILGLPWIPPELREDLGEIEAAVEGRLPRLLELKDIRGDMHVHSNWSDGRASLEALARAAKERGYAYLAVTDHSPASRIARGLSVERLRERNREIDKLNTRLKGIRILKGTEVDIAPDGSLDYPDSVLAEQDWVVAAVHSGFKEPQRQMTHRLVSAIRHPYVHVIAHPSGRLIGQREPYAVDLKAVLQAAADHGKAMEVNGYTQRLDLNDQAIRQARKTGVKLCLGSDAHLMDQLDMMALGVATARRGWTQREDVINTLPLQKLLS